MKHQWTIRGWATVAVAVWLAGCDGGANEALTQWMAEQRATVQPRVEPVAEPKPYVPQAFTQAVDLSPFSDEKLSRSLREESSPGASSALLAAELSRRKEPLEALPLDTMAMVGLMDRKGQKVALIRANNLLYQVRRGNYLGQNYGRITNITDTQVVLREIVQDAAGEWIERTASLELLEGTGK